MFDFDSLIGQEEKTAREILQKNGYNDVETIINSKKDAKTDTLIVVKAENLGSKVRLICGEFYLNIKG